MQRMIGTSTYGLRAPIVKAGDNLQDVVVDVLFKTIESHKLTLHAKDVLCITESTVARCQNNYCTVEDIVADLSSKFDEEIGVVFPITSRNRFSLIMKAIAQTEKKIKLFLTYPSDEVGNALFDKMVLLDNDIDSSTTTLDEAAYRKLIDGDGVHEFTGVNYVDLYKSYAVNDNIEVYLTNNVRDIAAMCKELLIANIHDREYYKKAFRKLGVEKVYSLADIMNSSINGSGYNEKYGLYGSNLAPNDRLKLFPNGCEDFVVELQARIKKEFGVELQVMVYGDGAFKDPQGKIWELADAVVSPGFTSGLAGTPNEVKIKYLADQMTGDLDAQISDVIRDKEDDLVGKDKSLGTTPRQFTDLLGSLADLTSGSGDKGTPIVLVQGYFDNYTDE